MSDNAQTYIYILNARSFPFIFILYVPVTSPGQQMLPAQQDLASVYLSHLHNAPFFIFFCFLRENGFCFNVAISYFSHGSHGVRTVQSLCCHDSRLPLCGEL